MCREEGGEGSNYKITQHYLNQNDSISTAKETYMAFRLKNVFTNSSHIVDILVLFNQQPE